MKIYLKIIGLILLTLLFVNSTIADSKVKTENDIPFNAKKIQVNIAVYNLDNGLTLNDYAKVLQKNKPEHQPSLLVLSGEPASIEVNSNTKKDNSIKINFLANKAATQYNLDFELKQGSDNSIAQIKSINIGRSTMFSASLNNVSKLIKVTTKLASTNQINTNGINAITQLTLLSKLNFKKPEQQYIQADKIWLSDNKLTRAVKRKFNSGFESSVEREYRYVYIENKDPKNIIKGVLKVENHINAAAFSGTDTRSISHRTFKNYLIEFYVLPNKKAFVSQFLTNSKLTLISAEYLSAEESAKLKKTNDTDKNGIKAIKHLTLLSKLNFIQPEQEYIQANKIWLNDNKLTRAVKRQYNNAFESTVEREYRYVYIENKDKKNIIKGLLKLDSHVNGSASIGANVRTVTQTTIKDQLIEFYILPNKKAFIGQFTTKTKLTLISAEYLSAEESAKLKIQQENK
jgi:hypothetical protein